MSAVVSQITSISIVCSTVSSGADQRKHQSSLAFVRGIHWWPVGEFPHKRPVTRKMFPFDDVIMPLVPVRVLKIVFSCCRFYRHIKNSYAKKKKKMPKLYRQHFPKHFSDKMSVFWLKCHHMRPHLWSGNGLVTSGNKPLPEPMLIQMCVTIWLIQAKLS